MKPAPPLAQAPRPRIDRVAALFYAGWVGVALFLGLGTFFLLQSVHTMQRQAALARAEAGAAALEQTLLRALEPVRMLQSLAQARASLLARGRGPAADAILEQIAEMVRQHRSGVLGMILLRPDGAADWRSDPRPLAVLPPMPPGQPGQPDALTFGRPALGGVRGPVITAARLLASDTGRTQGAALVLLDPAALADMLHHAARGMQVAALTLRLPDGAVLAQAGQVPDAAEFEQQVLEQAQHAAASGSDAATFETEGQHGRLAAVRIVAGAPVAVSASLDAAAAMAEYVKLRNYLIETRLAFVLASFLVARLLLNSYMLRYRLGEQALRDPLTGLANRRYLTDKMPQRLMAAQRQGYAVSLLLIDLDGFKPVNDTRGHPAGDALLKQVAARLHACAAASDTVLRLGGDEFAVLRIGRLQRRDSTALARFVVAELSRPFELDDGQPVRISASVGVATAPHTGSEISDLLRSADIALYLVKSQGGAGYRMFDLAMEETVRTRRALEIDLRDAITNGELEVYFQPLVRVQPRRVSGFEALIRWHHPSFGLVLPSRFIPIAEESGLIHEIGGWVLGQACAEAASWPGRERIAVNLSPLQFDRADIVEVVDQALRQTGLDPARLELEITEGVVMRETGDVLATMRRLQSLGVRLALDDFGTGYASLSYLRSFPFDRVKVDGSFLSDLHGDGGTIIRAVLGLCGTLRLETLVEGVETEAQLDWLMAAGCGEAQGHLFSLPRPAAMLPDVIRRIAASDLPEPRAADGLAELVPEPGD